MHTDGKVDQIIPDLIACGLDALHPIEPKAMDIVAVKRKYGDRLALLGNIDVDLLTRGSPEEIRVGRPQSAYAKSRRAAASPSARPTRCRTMCRWRTTGRWWKHLSLSAHIQSRRL